MTNNPKSNLPDEMFEDGGLAEGVQRAANALCENDDLSDALKDQLRSNLLFSAMGKDYYFSEAQAEKVLQKLMDAVLEIATSTDGAGGAQDDTEGKEAAAADGGAADPEPFCNEVNGDVKVEAVQASHERAAHTYRPRDLHMKRIQASNGKGRPAPPKRAFNPLDDLRDVDITYAVVMGENVPMSTPQDLLMHVVFEFCSRISSNVKEDVLALLQYAQLKAISKKKPHLKGHRYDPKTNLTLPILRRDELLRAVFRMARAAGMSIEIGVAKDALAPAVVERFSYVYDPDKLHEPKHEPAKEEAVCGPGMIFRFRYRDTQDIRSYYIAKGADDDRVMTKGTERITNGSPLARAVEGFGAGDTADVVIASDERPVQILDVWNPSASNEVIEIN